MRCLRTSSFSHERERKKKEKEKEIRAFTRSTRHKGEVIYKIIRLLPNTVCCRIVFFKDYSSPKKTIFIGALLNKCYKPPRIISTLLYTTSQYMHSELEGYLIQSCFYPHLCCQLKCLCTGHKESPAGCFEIL